MDENKLLSFAMEIGEIMLVSGAEINRVEDTVKRILSVGENTMPETFVTHTGLFASIQSPVQGCPITKLKRIPSRSINLEKITRANSLSRKFVEGKMTLEESMKELEEIKLMTPFKPWVVFIAYGAASFSFSILFDGGFMDSVAAFAIGVMLGAVNNFLGKTNTGPFLATLLGGVVIAVFSLLFYTLDISKSYTATITGAIMPLVPGIAITNAVRDIMNGDFISGSSRVAEALLIAGAIAAGIGTVLSAASTLGVI
ncbi:MAG: threonine/serine exporter family protein [Firmicutes bacterium]|nr:threonine/serine exporter family protein [Bacillota bacterium]